MSKLSNYIPDSNNNGKFDLEDVLDAIAKSSPLLIMITAGIAFSLLIIFESDYYTHVLGNRWQPAGAIAGGIAVAIVRELSRAVLLVMTFADFRKGNGKGAWLGLLMSLALVAYDAFSSGPISSLWTGAENTNIGAVVADLVIFLVALSFFLEFRLVISGKSNQRSASTPSNNSEVAHYKNLADEYASANELLMQQVKSSQNAKVRKREPEPELNFEDVDLKPYLNGHSGNGHGHS